VISVQYKLFNKLFQLHQLQLLQKVGTKPISSRSRISKTTCSNENCRKTFNLQGSNLNIIKHVQFQVYSSNAETGGTAWCTTDMDCTANPLERVICRLTGNDLMMFKKDFDIHFIKFQAWWEGSCDQQLQNTIEQSIIHFAYSMMHLVSHVSESI